jgi:sulfoxide reductase catalytic subunit YedY
MLIKPASDLSWRDVTDRRLYLRRREFLRAAAIAAGAAAAPIALPQRAAGGQSGAKLPHVKSPYSTDEGLTPFDDVTTYNNFYEFGIDKGDPSRHAGHLRTRPWTVTIDGHCAKGGQFAIDDLVKPYQLEERIYRLRCVEAWSMVIPWLGFGLGDLIRRFRPTSRAKYVAFTTLHDPERMPGQRRGVLDWPYREGLRIDEATHPLTMLAIGLYGRELPNQNGAPLRLVVPWKYGYKSIKGIVKIEFVEQEPPTSWNQSAPNEYGFYSNVNPDVRHPRWSQKSERRIAQGSGIFGSRIATQPFNGYADLVAPLYAGMDLRKFH